MAELQKGTWSGRWPTDEYPSDGTTLRYERKRDGAIIESQIVRCWCGIEPVFDMANGDHVCVTLDKWASQGARE